MLRRQIVCAFAALFALAGSAHAQLGLDPGYNALFFENFVSSNTETNGRLAVGGNATLRNYGVGKHAPGGEYSLVVGGTLDAANVGVNRGNVHAGAKTGTVYTNGPGATLTVGGTPPVDFADLAQGYGALSTRLGALAGTAGSTVTDRYGTWTFDAANAGLNVFSVDASAFDTACTVDIRNLTAGATAIINVYGNTARTTGCGMYINGSGASGDGTTALASRVLWNYVDATELIFRGSIIGSVLAPRATISTGWGQLVGDIVAKGGNSSMEYYVRPFDGDLPSATVTPEPVSTILLGTGLAGLAAARRRRRDRRDRES